MRFTSPTCLKLIFLAAIFALLAPLTSAETNEFTVKSETIHSAILGEDRFFKVSVPKRAASANSRSLRAIYLLDGDAHAENANAILTKLSKDFGPADATNTIVVSLGNIWQRDRDYTPTRFPSAPNLDKAAAENTGGGERFLSFLEKELIPHIGRNYPVGPSRAIVGHSFGGLLAIHAFAHHRALFTDFIAIDPSMWWHDEQLLNAIKKLSLAESSQTNSLFIAIANTAQKDMDPASIRKDRSEKTKLIRPTLELADHLQSLQTPRLRFQWKFYPQHDHMSVTPPALLDSFQFYSQIKNQITRDIHSAYPPASGADSNCLCVCRCFCYNWA